MVMNCPICGKKHDVKLKRRKASSTIKGEKVQYDEEYFACEEVKGDNEFATAAIENANLLRARNAYREKMGLLTSDEIVKIREKYGLSQVDLSQALGWGEATISRYESKAIQDSAYDNVLQLIRINPLILYYLYIQNGAVLNKNKEGVLMQRIREELLASGREIIARDKLESFYITYNEATIENGFKCLDIDKLETIINYLAKKIKNLFKVKLMKMLWYVDILSFQMNNRSMTGLVYQHATMGALPIGHDAILQLDNVSFLEEMSPDYDNVKYHIIYNEKLDLKGLTKDERNIIDSVITKFNSMNTKEIVDYMHEEEAYKQTNDGEIISFEWAKSLNKF
ncbi:type II TA system antitoxin MqsA family protein [Pseudobutyrivibrio xylanivorans]|uniref:Putative zinc finger/helix-turn-helix protein, YgiT family n=1 Tax=Pseudobutyrivibrio xylanivorans TaxID=185007 RepID=A0A1G5S087_PSEXY|nr:type II TA system antitoxin MqsA family protein [Pseudobutyrivibrio xylanivorans]SCZ79815.1 putative zinc finger/helix-turn-helix protein, YgiT family [Pseudobutyrivibrio xylanivorans]